MTPAIFPYGDQGFAAFAAWTEEAQANLAAMRDELERRYRKANTTLAAALKAHAPEGMLQACDRLAEDMEAVSTNPTPAGYYRFQAYSRARTLMLAQIYQLELDRTQSLGNVHFTNTHHTKH